MSSWWSVTGTDGETVYFDLDEQGIPTSYLHQRLDGRIEEREKSILNVARFAVSLFAIMEENDLHKIDIPAFGLIALDSQSARLHALSSRAMKTPSKPMAARVDGTLVDVIGWDNEKLYFRYVGDEQKPLTEWEAGITGADPTDTPREDCCLLKIPVNMHDPDSKIIKNPRIVRL